MPTEQSGGGLGERHPLWAQLPSLPEPTSEQLAELRGQIHRRARAGARRWLGPSLLLLLAVAGPHPDSNAFLLLTTTSRAEASTSVRIIGALARPTFSIATPTEPSPPAFAPPSRDDVVPSPPPHSLASPRPAPRAPERTSGAPALHPADGETALLAAALQRLHREHDPSGALSLLSDYDRRFPRGELAPEVALVQAEALLKLGRREELVEHLDPEVTRHLPRAPELSLLRAEALAKLGRCQEAMSTFSPLLDEALEGALEPATRERALFGRALCRAAVGKTEGAREDLLRLLVEFPAEKPKVLRALDALDR